MTSSSPSTSVALTSCVAPGRVHRPGSAGFADAIRLWNGAVTARPAVVAQPISVTEVQGLVRYARDNDMPISVRGGGHDWAGRALVDDGLVIDMSLMRRVNVDAASRAATFGGGATAADVVSASAPDGLVPATGNFGEVGMVGLTLGGGYGPLNGIAGLALDNVLGAQLVLHDGTVIMVDADRDPELFWALRGGGANFGVVTSLRVRLHPMTSVVAGVILFPWHQAREVFRRYDELVPTMPDELTVQIGVLPGPNGESVVFLSPMWSGSTATATEWMDRLRGLGTPLLSEVAPMPYSATLRLLDPYIVWGRHHEMRTRNLRTFSSGAIDALIHAGDSLTSPYSGIAIHHFHGAATRVPVGETAFGIRTPHFLVEVLAAWDPADDGSPHRNWADTVYGELREHAIEGGYPNLIGPGQASQANAAYGPNADRLLAAKRRYDPKNTFSATSLPVNRVG